MKLWKHFGMIILAMIIGLSLAACNNPAGGGNGGNAPPTSGRLTITGLEDYNGMYVTAYVSSEEGTMYAAEDINLSVTEMVGGKISNGSVTLKIWELVFEDEDYENPELKSYGGSNQGCYFTIFISSKAGPFYEESSNIFVAEGHIYSVNFSNGVGSGSAWISTVDLGNGIKGDLHVSDEGSSYYPGIINGEIIWEEIYSHNIHLNCHSPYHWETENSYDFYQDFEVIVNGQTIAFDDTGIEIWSGEMSFSFDNDEPLFTVGETCTIQIIYTANPDRPIKVWMPDWDADDWDVPPANAGTLASFDTGVKTVLAEEW